MSALGDSITPCPSRSRSSGLSDYSGSETFDSLLDGDLDFEPTEQIEFTTEIRPPTLTGVRPRRANGTASSFRIHDEVGGKPINQAENRKQSNGTTNIALARKTSLLAQPAQRFRPKVNIAPSPPSRAMKPEAETRGNARVEPSETLSASHTNKNHPNGDDGENTLKKRLRRNTVYIPSDDTTVASVFMGLFSPLKQIDKAAQALSTRDTQVKSIEARFAERQARKSLAVSVHRSPLQPSAKIAQEAATRIDIAGKNGGKENIPPGVSIGLEKKDRSKRVLSSQRNRAVHVLASKPDRRNMATAEPVITIPKEQRPQRQPLSAKQSNLELTFHCRSRVLEQPRKQLSASLSARASALRERIDHSEGGRFFKVERALLKSRRLDHEYPRLTEDIPKPALYEDNWLSHQETVITQLVNALFESTDGYSTVWNTDTLRLGLIELYHTDYFSQLYMRLKVSISCGTLSIPRNALSRSKRLNQDVGLKRKFLDILIHSYDLRALAAAAETIVGRRISNNPKPFELGSEGPYCGAAKRSKNFARRLETFLEVFLLRNDDFDPSLSGTAENSAMQAQTYCRTVLRTILLVVLLDRARQRPGALLPRRLFTPSSAFKSSAELLQALGRILLPTCGDIIKSLNHLDCHLSYKQHQLQEYDYQVDNLAVDLRDGVRLTRIIETLFFTAKHQGSDSNDQIDVTLSGGGTLSLLKDEQDLPLSKHLKYPCNSRAAKIFNVQLALAALASVKGSSALLSIIRPEDVVDGYREKTIALLWALVSKWGLASLVDWTDLEKEILRLRKKLRLQSGHEQIQSKDTMIVLDSAAQDGHTRMLQQWAGILAASKGLQIDNMTSSFANGKIYESIIDEYEPYIIGRSSDACTKSGESSTSVSLQTRLQQLGCSTQFAHLISQNTASSHIIEQDYTLGSLAFLCSRLLSASQYARAAIVLQHAWRTYLAKQEAARRTVARILAEHCAAVVQTRNEILWAKEVIVRRWRMIKAQKQPVSSAILA